MRSIGRKTLKQEKGGKKTNTRSSPSPSLIKYQLLTYPTFPDSHFSYYRRKLSSEDALLCFFMYIYHLAPLQLLVFFYKVDMKTMQRSMLGLCNIIFKVEPPSREEIEQHSVWFRGVKVVGIIDGLEQQSIVQETRH
jgi:hypothetical protein